MFRRLLERIAKALSEAEIPYMVIGGQAVLLYGEPRLTKDIDITLGVDAEGLGKVKAIVEGLRLRILVSDPEGFVKKAMVLPVMDDESGIRVDFIFSFSSYEKQAIERAIEVKFGEIGVRFAALEDVIIHKIVAGRDRDIEDVKVLLLKNPDYDEGYIRRWLNEFDRSLGEKFSRTFERLTEELAR